MIRAICALSLIVAMPVWAQDTIQVQPLDDIETLPLDQDARDYTVPGFMDTQRDDIGFLNDVMVPQIVDERAELAQSGILRVLDRVSGKLTDLELKNGQQAQVGRIEIALRECRYPQVNPSSDAFAYLTVRDTGAADAAFEGWMVASSPALNALDHSRYDVWVMRCNSS